MSTESNEEEIKNIVDQLQRLQLEQTELLTRLEHLNEETGGRDETTARAAGPTSRNPKRELAIGDSVRIKNPTFLQANKGTITKINLATDRITVQTSSGAKIVRASKNLTAQR
jgi:hypothetical protein